MVNIRVVKTIYNLTGKLLQLLLGKGQCGDNLVKYCFIHEITDVFVLHGLSYNIIAAEPGSQYEGSVCTV